MPVKVRMQGASRDNDSEWRRGNEKTRELLIETALVLFAKKGYRGTSLRDLAAAAGVTTGACYSNFHSKREIYSAMIENITATIQKMVDEAVKEIIDVMKTRGDSRIEFELLRRPLHRLLDEASRYNALMHLLLKEGLGKDPEFQKDIDRIWERLVSMAKRGLDMYIEAGFAKPYETELIARSFVPMAIAMSLHDAETKGEKREDIVSLLASMIHGGASQWVVWKELEKRT